MTVVLNYHCLLSFFHIFKFPHFQIFKFLSIKDYYSILELPPSATLDEIKKAYRRLALQYHPDKNQDDFYAQAQFTEIKEAYETLTHPGRKERYLQQRWYAQSIGQRTTQRIVTPVTILKQVLDLDKYVRTLDMHRMDHLGLQQYVCDLLSDENIKKVNSFNEKIINKEIVLSVLKSIHHLPINNIEPIAVQLRKLAVDDNLANGKIDHLVAQRRQAQYWEKKRVWIIFLVVILICCLIILIA